MQKRCAAAGKVHRRDVPLWQKVLRTDIRLVPARQLVWDKEAWRQPARIGFAIRLLQRVLDSEAESVETRAEAEMLMKKLRLAGKESRLG